MSAKTEGLTGSIGLPGRTMTWIGVGMVASSAVIIAISVFFGVSISDIEKIGLWTFLLAAAVSSVRLLVQIVRFRLVTSSLIADPRVDLHGLATARLGSEFVALSTPSMSGGEFVRAAWLSLKGVEMGKAFWIGYFELIADVYVVSALGLVASVYALSRGAFFIGSVILVVVLILTAAYTIFFLVPAMKGPPKVPRRVFSLASRFIGRSRARHLQTAIQRGAEGFSIAARAMLRRGSLPLVLKVLCLSVAEAFLTGLALWIILSAAGVNIDMLSSTLVAYGGITMASLPISIAGSGVIELTTQSYLSSVFGFSSWTAVIIWRIVSFQFLLVITGVAFIILVRQGTKKHSGGHGR